MSTLTLSPRPASRQRRAVLLAGLLLTGLLGWSWADPAAALVIAGLTAKEGVAAWHGDACCTPAAVLAGEAEDECDGTCTCCTH